MERRHGHDSGAHERLQVADHVRVSPGDVVVTNHVWSPSLAIHSTVATGLRAVPPGFADRCPAEDARAGAEVDGEPTFSSNRLAVHFRHRKPAEARSTARVARVERGGGRWPLHPAGGQPELIGTQKKVTLRSTNSHDPSG